MEEVRILCSAALLAAGGAAEDRLLREALEARGLRCALAAWEAVGGEAGEIATGTSLVVRSCWDYAERLEAFRSWLDAIASAAVPLVNSVDTLRWNLDKRYLLELEEAGVPVVPTLVTGREELAGACRAFEGDARTPDPDRIIVKPTVGATASGLVCVERGAVLDPRGMRSPTDRWLVQPFLEEIEQVGEWSVVAFGGSVHYAVLKRAAAGEYRVQSDFGGSSELLPAPPAVLEVAEAALAACRARLGSAPTIARVDVVAASVGPLLMELELIEPELFLPLAGRAAVSALADELERALRAGR